MILYLTYNDLPSGIYSGQVIDVIKHLRAQFECNIRLAAFISIRNFRTNKRKIKKELPDAVVLPMFPGVKRWRANTLMLQVICKKLKVEKIIGRSVLATQLALKTKVKKIVYDGRGAIAAEWKEYKVINDKNMLSEILSLEQECILKSNYRISVSNELIKHWREEYSYKSNDHVVIPCTLNNIFEKQLLYSSEIEQARNKLKIKKDEVVLAYSGSLAGWQSFELLSAFIHPILKENEKVKLLFLSNMDSNISKLQDQFPGKIICLHTSPQEIPSLLIAADYGLLIREKSVTNKVASPVKFAEYLSCGLKIILSEELGDYSHFVLKNKVGQLYTDKIVLEQSPLEEKQRLRNLALDQFSKSAYKSSYQKVLSV